MNRRSFLRNILFASAYLAIPSVVKSACEIKELPEPIEEFKFTSGSRQWATGAIKEREQVCIKPKYSCVGASTITDAYGMYVEAPMPSSINDEIKADLNAMKIYLGLGYSHLDAERAFILSGLKNKS